MMIKKELNIIFAAGLIISSIFWTGCTKNSGSEVAKTDNVNQPLPADSNKNIAVNSPDIPTANMTTGTPAAIVNNSNAQTVVNKKLPTALKAPTPIIGSGGEDLLLFTQVRAAFSSDQALNYVIIEVKEGNVTLSGNVSDKDLKAKAEHLAQSVKGVKSVKNNLNIS